MVPIVITSDFYFLKIVMAINEWPEREGTMKAGGEALWICKEGRIKLDPRGRMQVGPLVMGLCEARVSTSSHQYHECLSSL